MTQYALVSGLEIVMFSNNKQNIIKEYKKFRAPFPMSIMTIEKVEEIRKQK